MKLILICATAILVAGEDLVNYHVNNKYHIQPQEPGPNVGNSYNYGPDGQVYKVGYTAYEDGFQARSDDSPLPIQVVADVPAMAPDTGLANVMPMKIGPWVNEEAVPRALLHDFYGTPVEQPDLTGLIVDSASADFPLQNYDYSFDRQADSPGYSPENRKKWESVEYGAWGALRVALNQIPITPAGTYKVDTPDFYNQWHINRNNLYLTN